MAPAWAPQENTHPTPPHPLQSRDVQAAVPRTQILRRGAAVSGCLCCCLTSPRPPLTRALRLLRPACRQLAYGGEDGYGDGEGGGFYSGCVPVVVAPPPAVRSFEATLALSFSSGAELLSVDFDELAGALEDSAEAELGPGGRAQASLVVVLSGRYRFGAAAADIDCGAVTAAYAAEVGVDVAAVEATCAEGAGRRLARRRGLLQDDDVSELRFDAAFATADAADAVAATAVDPTAALSAAASGASTEATRDPRLSIDATLSLDVTDGDFAEGAEGGALEASLETALEDAAEGYAKSVGIDSDGFVSVQDFEETTPGATDPSCECPAVEPPGCDRIVVGSVCRARADCAWAWDGREMACRDECALRDSKKRCQKVDACVWEGGACAEAERPRKCSKAKKKADCAGGCVWDSEDKECADPECSALHGASKSVCVSWDSCEFDAEEDTCRERCAAFGKKSQCTKRGRCRWSGSKCKDADTDKECKTYKKKINCKADDDCSWDGGRCGERAASKCAAQRSRADCAALTKALKKKGKKKRNVAKCAWHAETCLDADLADALFGELSADRRREYLWDQGLVCTYGADDSYGYSQYGYDYDGAYAGASGGEYEGAGAKYGYDYAYEYASESRPSPRRRCRYVAADGDGYQHYTPGEPRGFYGYIGPGSYTAYYESDSYGYECEYGYSGYSGSAYGYSYGSGGETYGYAYEYGYAYADEDKAQRGAYGAYGGAYGYNDYSSPDASYGYYGSYGKRSAAGGYYSAYESAYEGEYGYGAYDSAGTYGYGYGYDDERHGWCAANTRRCERYRSEAECPASCVWGGAAADAPSPRRALLGRGGYDYSSAEYGYGYSYGYDNGCSFDCGYGGYSYGYGSYGYGSYGYGSYGYEAAYSGAQGGYYGAYASSYGDYSYGYEDSSYGDYSYDYGLYGSCRAPDGYEYGYSYGDYEDFHCVAIPGYGYGLDLDDDDDDDDDECVCPTGEEGTVRAIGPEKGRCASSSSRRACERQRGCAWDASRDGACRAAEDYCEDIDSRRECAAAQRRSVCVWDAARLKQGRARDAEVPPADGDLVTVAVRFQVPAASAGLLDVKALKRDAKSKVASALGVPESSLASQATLRVRETYAFAGLDADADMRALACAYADLVGVDCDDVAAARVAFAKRKLAQAGVAFVRFTVALGTDAEGVSAAEGIGGAVDSSVGLALATGAVVIISAAPEAQLEVDVSVAAGEVVDEGVVELEEEALVAALRTALSELEVDEGVEWELDVSAPERASPPPASPPLPSPPPAGTPWWLQRPPPPPPAAPRSSPPPPVPTAAVSPPPPAALVSSPPPFEWPWWLIPPPPPQPVQAPAPATGTPPRASGASPPPPLVPPTAMEGDDDESDGGGLSTGAGVGIGVGVFIGVAMIAAAAAVLRRRGAAGGGYSRSGTGVTIPIEPRELDFGEGDDGGGAANPLAAPGVADEPMGEIRVDRSASDSEGGEIQPAPPSSDGDAAEGVSNFLADNRAAAMGP